MRMGVGFAAVCWLRPTDGKLESGSCPQLVSDSCGIGVLFYRVADYVLHMKSVLE